MITHLHQRKYARLPYLRLCLQFRVRVRVGFRRRVTTTNGRQLQRDRLSSTLYTTDNKHRLVRRRSRSAFHILSFPHTPPFRYSRVFCELVSQGCISGAES
jgi:hypothetical protein